MTDATEDRVVEAMARAMAASRFYNPNIEWRNYVIEAKSQYRSHLAMVSVLRELELVQKASEFEAKAKEAAKMALVEIMAWRTAFPNHSIFGDRIITFSEDGTQAMELDGTLIEFPVPKAPEKPADGSSPSPAIGLPDTSD